MALKPESQWKIWAGHCHLPPHHDKVYVIWIENRGDTYAVNGGYDKRVNKDAGGQHQQLRVQPKGIYPTLEATEARMRTVIREKESKYTNVRSPSYHPKLFSVTEALKRIDTSRLEGYSDQQVVAAPAKPLKVKEQKDVGSGRVGRTLDI